MLPFMREIVRSGLSNSQGPESLAKLVEELGPCARAASVEDAIAAGDIVSLAIPLATFETGSLANSWRIEPNTPIYFWPYAPAVPEGLTEDEAKQIYK
jgi:hypothetical protein